MNRLLTNIDTKNKDYFHEFGQFYMSPLLVVIGRFYQIKGNTVSKLPNSTTLAKICAIVVVFLTNNIASSMIGKGFTAGLLLARLCIVAVPVALGAILIQFSKSHQNEYELTQQKKDNKNINDIHDTN